MNTSCSSSVKMYSRPTDHRSKTKRRSSIGTSETKPKKNNTLVALIVDSGAYSIKAGLSTDVLPTIIPNCIMKAKSERKRLFIGNQIDDCRDCSGVYFLLPCERGYITKWDVQKPVWDFLFSRNVYSVNERPVIMTQPLFNFKSIQDCMDEIFFEEYEVKSMFRVNPTDLARLKYAKERQLTEDTPCVIVDTGFSFTHVIPYIGGNKYLRGIRRMNVGGKLLTNHLKDIISYRQYNVMEETFVINQVKEDTCYVAKDVKEELRLAAKPEPENSIVKNYVLPDFNNIRRGYVQDPNDLLQKEKEESCQILKLNNERFIVPEILFHPSDIGMKSMGIAEAVVKSISLCPKEHQENLARNIVLVGGNCKFPGFRERMYQELRSQLPHLWEVVVYQPDDPITYSWKGGEALLKIPDFDSYLVTKEEYEELGSSIIQQRFSTWMTDNADPKEEPRKAEQVYCYLDKLRGKSIFGKQEQGAEDSQVADDNRNSNAEGESVDSGIIDEVSGFDQTMLDNSEHLSERDSRLKKPALRDDKSRSEYMSLDSSESDDLMNSVDIFPFGTRSYL
nr:actin-related protein 6-like [Leptinotarsa decemlineata]